MNNLIPYVIDQMILGATLKMWNKLEDLFDQKVSDAAWDVISTHPDLKDMIFGPNPDTDEMVFKTRSDARKEFENMTGFNPEDYIVLWNKNSITRNGQGYRDYHRASFLMNRE